MRCWIFSPMKASWKRHLKNWQMENIGETLTKKDFLKVFKAAWDTVTSFELAVRGFRRSGLFPLDPSGIDKTKLEPSKLANPVTMALDRDQVPSQALSTRQCKSACSSLKTSPCPFPSPRKGSGPDPSTRQCPCPHPSTRRCPCPHPSTRQCPCPHPSLSTRPCTSRCARLSPYPSPRRGPCPSAGNRTSKYPCSSPQTDPGPSSSHSHSPCVCPGANVWHRSSQSRYISFGNRVWP
ncbi:hypothetical protein DPMN_054493 [Dreissena polymorpha]|uniref:Uncharacterized protein n=1 Tax=Dreissena polymorpha TaxID=45954 RepID=A0A9D4CPK4_DREPO|nr:hypothetical protein DPMN_054493 [Dreissena polymorpha]